MTFDEKGSTGIIDPMGAAGAGSAAGGPFIGSQLVTEQHWVLWLTEQVAKALNVPGCSTFSG